VGFHRRPQPSPPQPGLALPAAALLLHNTVGTMACGGAAVRILRGLPAFGVLMTGCTPSCPLSRQVYVQIDLGADTGRTGADANDICDRTDRGCGADRMAETDPVVDNGPSFVDLSVEVVGQGTVTSLPAGIDCPPLCAAVYPLGVDVTLTGSPACGSAFAGWDNDCVGSTATAIASMTTPRNCLARFEPYASSDTWARVYPMGSYARATSIEEAEDGGVIFVGQAFNGAANSGAGDTDLLVVKLNADSTLAWAVSGGGPSPDGTLAMAPLSDGAVVAGWLGGDGWTIGTWAWRLDNDGRVVWSKQVGTGNNAFFSSVVVNADGELLFTGVGNGFGQSLPAVWLVKLDADGQLLWQRVYPGDHGTSVVRLVEATTEGYAVVASRNELNVDPSAELIRTDAYGEVLWANRYSIDGSLTPYDVVPLEDGGFVVAGGASSVTAPRVGWVIRLDVTGGLVWARRLGTVGDRHSEITSVRRSCGGLILAAYIGDCESIGSCAVVLAEMNLAGDVLWSRTYDGAGYPWAVRSTHDNGILVAAETRQYAAADHYYDPWILRAGPDGTISGQCPSGLGASVDLAFEDLEMVAVPTGTQAVDVFDVATTVEIESQPSPVEVSAQCSP
jgi:hypothetical protein